MRTLPSGTPGELGGSAPNPVADVFEAGERGDALSRLSPREREILALMAQGRSNAAICQQLFVSPKTLERHIGNIFLKLGLHPAPEDHRRVLAVLRYLNIT